jgi:ubiquinone/menaquinone biosynthesis C-methylase UbiE
MPVYADFANIYDRMMAGRYASLWWKVFSRLAARHGLRARTALDLAGGTGEAARRLRRLGMKVYIVDRSDAMLAKARTRVPAAEGLRQDMRRFKLPQSVDLAVCVFGGLNYLPSRGQMLQTLRRVHDQLKPGGVFCPDLVSTAHLLHHYRRGCEVHAAGTYYSVWQHGWDAQRRAARIEVTSFERQGRVWTRHAMERHWHYAYARAEFERLLRTAGFAVREVAGIPSGEAPRRDDSYWMFWAQKPGAG